jgi:hypothetical protein
MRFVPRCKQELRERHDSRIDHGLSWMGDGHGMIGQQHFATDFRHHD